MKGLTPKGAERKVSKFSSNIPQLLHCYKVTARTALNCYVSKTNGKKQCVCSPQPPPLKENKTVTNYEWHAMAASPQLTEPWTGSSWLTRATTGFVLQLFFFFLPFLLPLKVDRKTWFCIYLLNRSCLKIELEIEDFVKRSSIFWLTLSISAY